MQLPALDKYNNKKIVKLNAWQMYAFSNAEKLGIDVKKSKYINVFLKVHKEAEELNLTGLISSTISTLFDSNAYASYNDDKKVLVFAKVYYQKYNEWLDKKTVGG